MSDEDFYREFAMDVDVAHATDSGSRDVPPGLWQQIRSQFSSYEEESIMNSPAITLPPVIDLPVPISERTRSFGVFSNMAATIALVATLALGGWFAAMNLRGNNDPVPHWAAQPSTPLLAQTCDVEPMTVEEAMEILKNPFKSFDATGSAVEIQSSIDLASEEDVVKTGMHPVQTYLTDSPRSDLAADEVNAALAFGDDYITCLIHGTTAQVFTFLYPVLVHQVIRDQLPLFVTEAEARTLVTSMLSQPANSVWTTETELTYLADKSIALNRNSEYQYVDTSIRGRFPDFLSIMVVPLVFYGPDGEVVLETELGGFPVTNNGYSSDYARNVTLALSAIDGRWYVIEVNVP